MTVDYAGPYHGPDGPSEKALSSASSALGAFMYFLPPVMWASIADASNDYFKENLDKRAEAQHAKQVTRSRKKPGYKVSSLEKIQDDIEQLPEVTGRELCVFVGLLIARSIAPNKEKLQHHWKTYDEGAIPYGCFGTFMVRDRFLHISRNLHFSSNAGPRVASDRAWKLRPIIDVLVNASLKATGPHHFSPSTRPCCHPDHLTTT